MDVEMSQLPLLADTEEFDDSGDHNIFRSPRRFQLDLLKKYPRNLLLWLISVLRDKETYLWLLPGFVASSLRPTPANKPTKKITQTAVLDGLRGLSCLGVVIFHYSEDATFACCVNPWPEEGPRFWHLPILNILWSGRAQVRVFLTISGYVLPLRCLRGLHNNREADPNFASIASSVLRRGIRLYPPAFATIFIIFVMLRLGLFENAREVKALNDRHHTYPFRFGEAVPVRLPTFGAQFSEALQIMLGMVADDHLRPKPAVALWARYDEHLWSVYTEFYTSMFLLLVLLGTSRLKVCYRLSIHIILAVSCWSLLYDASFFFMSGMILAELNIILENYANSLTSDSESTVVTKSNSGSPRWKRWICSGASSALHSRNFMASFFIVIWALSLYLLSLPIRNIETTPGYRHILDWLPWFMKQHPHDIGPIFAIQGLGAVLFTWTVSNTTKYNPFRTFNKFFFANPISLYIGKLSYSIYLLHGCITRSAGYVALPYIYKAVIPVERRNDHNALTPFEFSTMFTIGLCFWILPLVIWAADLMTRFIDTKSIKLASWCERKMLQPTTGKELKKELGAINAMSLPRNIEGTQLSTIEEPKLA